MTKNNQKTSQDQERDLCAIPRQDFDKRVSRRLETNTQVSRTTDSYLLVSGLNWVSSWFQWSFAVANCCLFSSVPSTNTDNWPPCSCSSIKHVQLLTSCCISILVVTDAAWCCVWTGVGSERAPATSSSSGTVLATRRPCRSFGLIYVDISFTHDRASTAANEVSHLNWAISNWVVKVSGSQTPCFRYGPPYLKARPTCSKSRSRCFERRLPCYRFLNWAMSDPWGRDHVGLLICNVIRAYPGRIIGLTDRSLLAGGQLSLC